MASGAGPDTEVERVHVEDGRVAFSFGGGDFVYDRLGLRRREQDAGDKHKDESDA